MAHPLRKRSTQSTTFTKLLHELKQNQRDYRNTNQTFRPTRKNQAINNYINLTLEGPCIIFCNIYTVQRDTQCCSTDCLLMYRCHFYMFRTVTVHPQELLFRCCMCRLWYVLIRPAGTTFEEELHKQSVLLHSVSRWNVHIFQKNYTRTFQCQVHKC